MTVVPRSSSNRTGTCRPGIPKSDNSRKRLPSKERRSRGRDRHFQVRVVRIYRGEAGAAPRATKRKEGRHRKRKEAVLALMQSNPSAISWPHRVRSMRDGISYIKSLVSGLAHALALGMRDRRAVPKCHIRRKSLHAFRGRSCFPRRFGWISRYIDIQSRLSLSLPDYNNPLRSGTPRPRDRLHHLFSTFRIRARSSEEIEVA